MTFSFKPATREGVHVLFGLISGTGGGKTYSAMRLAKGLSGGKRFAVIDTEAGRAKHYADDFDFDHGDLAPPFTPGRYMEAIAAADAAGYPCIVVDSMSHEHAGEGGMLDMFEHEFERMGRREPSKMSAWIKPKMEHKRMVSRLLQLRSHLILCFRAEPKVKMEKDDKGKTQVIDMGWQPVAAKGLEFELTASFLLHHERPGFPDSPLKLPEQLRPFFAPGRPIDEKAGEAVARWAAGAATQSRLGEAMKLIAAADSEAALTAVQSVIRSLGLAGSDLDRARSAYKDALAAIKARTAEDAESSWDEAAESEHYAKEQADRARAEMANGEAATEG